MKNVSASTVRNWLAENGGAGKRGRIKKADADRFNAAHKGKALYTPESDAEKRHTEIPGVVSLDKAGRKVTKTVTVTTETARSFYPGHAGKRGRLAKADIALAMSAVNAEAVASQFV